MLKVAHYSVLLFGVCWGMEYIEDISDEALLRYNIAQKIVIKTYTPSKDDARHVFAPFLAEATLRPFLISIANDSDVDFVLSKRNIGLKLPSHKQIYRSNAGLFVPGLMLYIAGCLDNIGIKTVSLLTSLAILWREYNTYVFFESMLLKDDELVIIKAHEQIQKIIVVDDNNFKGVFTVFLENRRAGYLQDFTIDIVQNGCSEKFSVMLQEANYA
jgi:hypothetical protein